MVMLDGVDDLALIFVASQWPFLLFTFFAIAFSALKVRRLDKNSHSSSTNLESIFNGFRFGGHRGSPMVKPENTIASMEQAHEEGVDLIEFDVSLTRDGVAVILHDDTLDRTTNMSGPIRSFFHRELVGCDTAAKFAAENSSSASSTCSSSSSSSSESRQALPTLDEMVEWARARHMKMIFDVKDSDQILCDKLASLFDAYDLYSLGVVCSFHPRVVYRLKKRHSQIPTGITWRRWQFSTLDCDGTIPRYTPRPLQLVAVTVDMLYAWAIRSALLPRFLGADLVLTHRAEISEGFVKLQQRKGLKVCAWTVNDPNEMTWMHRTLHIPFLTDKPFLAREMIVEQQRCAHSDSADSSMDIAKSDAMAMQLQHLQPAVAGRPQG